MADIIDYLNWRGDLSFSQDSFNEIDALILTFISYLEFERYILLKKEISFEDLYNKVIDNKDYIEHKKSILDRISTVRMSYNVFEAAAKTNRFKNVKIKNYISEINLTEEYQFSVMSFQFDESKLFVGYRGTDESIIGWKEDFNMLFLNEIPGQIKALNYLNYINLDNIKDLYIGGHSKGGNLAIFASSYAKKEVVNKIKSIYNFDGPGFSHKFLDNEGYKGLSSRIKTFIPEESIVGMLFERLEDVIIIKSSKTGFIQHNYYYWNVLGKNLEEGNLSNQSINIDKTCKHLLNTLSLTDKENLVNVVYDFLCKINVKTIDDFFNLNIGVIQDFFKYRNEIPNESKQVFFNILKILIDLNKNL